MFTDIHGQAARAAAEAVALGTVFAAVALLAKQLATVLGCVRAVEALFA